MKDKSYQQRRTLSDPPIQNNKIDCIKISRKLKGNCIMIMFNVYPTPAFINPPYQLSVYFIGNGGVGWRGRGWLCQNFNHYCRAMYLWTKRPHPQLLRKGKRHMYSPVWPVMVVFGYDVILHGIIQSWSVTPSILQLPLPLWRLEGIIHCIHVGWKGGTTERGQRRVSYGTNPSHITAQDDDDDDEYAKPVVHHKMPMTSEIAMLN